MRSYSLFKAHISIFRNATVCFHNLEGIDRNLNLSHALKVGEAKLKRKSVTSLDNFYSEDDFLSFHLAPIFDSPTPFPNP